MSEQRIDSRPPTIRAATGVPRAGTATDRRPRRQEAEDKRKGNDSGRKRRHLYDLLFEEIDQVPELELDQRERLKRNIRAHLALRARDQTPLPTMPPPPKTAADTDAETPQAAPQPPPYSEPPPLDQEQLINIAAPQHPNQPPEELEQNAQLAAQLRDCLTRNSDVARKVAVYLHILLSIDGALEPHLIIDI